MNQLLTDLAETIRLQMVEGHLTLSVAESCTSGQIAAALSSVDGASAYFQGGLVAYQDWVKQSFLGVEADAIRQFNVVSRQVVEQMVEGACHSFHTSMAIASTGYAGAGSNGIPSGTIWIGWGRPGDLHSQMLLLHGSRNDNTAWATASALRAFCAYLGHSCGREAACRQ